MNLTHYHHSEPFTLDRQWGYTRRNGTGLKPVGFWVSVDGEDDWPAWCRSQEFRLGSLAVPHTVTLTDTANVLVIDTATSLRKFDQAWSRDSTTTRYGTIDWGAVAERWDGIIIAPYQWSCRRDGPFWYYGWDCASGCIWNLDAIADVRPVAEVAS